MPSMPLLMHELADVISHFLPPVQSSHKLPAYKLRVLDALLKCRTPYMGGHVEACDDCGQVRVAHNSCRNRHCPKCGAIDKEKWVIAREADLLEIKYFHVVFTVPDKLNKLFLVNQRQMYNLLFSVAWDVLNDFGKDKKWIGGRIGATAILHTWGQKLNYHPHLHMIVPAGALMENGTWKHSRKRGKYLFKVDMLSNAFRGRFVDAVRELLAKKSIIGRMPSGLYDKPWVVYAKQPFGGPRQVVSYLGRYTHRTAISNDRILKVTPGKVTFCWRDYANKYARQTTTMEGQDFLDLFCQHILPPGYTRIRHYGFLSSASKKRSLADIRKALGTKSVADDAPPQLWQQIAFERMGIRPGVCKCCGGTMVIVQVIPDQFHQGKRAPPDKRKNPTACISAS